MKLDLNDLRPQEAKLELSEHPGKTYVISKITLRVQIWLNERFGKEKISEIFTNASLPEIAEIIYYLVKDKTDFPTLPEFLDAVVTQQDRVNLMTAMMQSVGISQPLLKKLSEDEAPASGNAPSPSLPIGANSTTSSDQSTATA